MLFYKGMSRQKFSEIALQIKNLREISRNFQKL